jgi:uncharacterized protein YnzC (UPF0291/DUF896 family)
MSAIIHLSEAEAEKLGLIQKFKSTKEYERYRKGKAYQRIKELESKMKNEGITEKELKEYRKLKKKYPSLWEKILYDVGNRLSNIDSVEYEFDDLEGEL